MSAGPRYPPIGDYALIGDCESAALVSRHGSIDWCCMPRIDHGSCFGRLLDWDRGGYCEVRPCRDDVRALRDYADGTLVLETRLAGSTGEAMLWDCFTLDADDGHERGPRLLRVIEGGRGYMDFDVCVAPRFDYGELTPWVRYHDVGVFSASGGDDALVITGDLEFDAGKHELRARASVRAGQRVRLAITFAAPELLERQAPEPTPAEELDRALEQTLDWWRAWSSQARPAGPERTATIRSALVLKALSNRWTGAIAAAPTTSLPEAPGGDRNWDYRYSWIRDSAFSARSLTLIGFREEADAFRRFVERTAAGTADGLKIMYGVGGERRLTEVALDRLEGYRGARPVRIGNAASDQLQLDVYGELLELAWRWHERGHASDDDYWRFLLDVVDTAAASWSRPDRGIWEIRGEPRHFVHSKAMCWAALDRGIRLAEESLRQAPLERWRKERDKVRARVERDGYDARRGVFVQELGGRALDASLLLLPAVGFVAWDDERMVRTVDAIRDELSVDGLLLRYRGGPKRQGRGRGADCEGVFLPCSFWLAECLARQGRHDEARAVFDRCAACGNDLGLFSEEYDTDTREMLGNFPQGLTHLSYISAAAALGAESGLELERA
jgi:GH15 family glucan-1,4-alpha-glucosidase